MIYSETRNGVRNLKAVSPNMPYHRSENEKAEECIKRLPSGFVLHRNMNREMSVTFRLLSVIP